MENGDSVMSEYKTVMWPDPRTHMRLSAAVRRLARGRADTRYAIAIARPNPNAC